MADASSGFAQPKGAVWVKQAVLPKPLGLSGFGALGKPASLAPLVVDRLKSRLGMVEPAYLQASLDQKRLASRLVSLLLVLAALEPVALVCFPGQKIVEQIVQHNHVLRNVKRPHTDLAHDTQIHGKADVRQTVDIASRLVVQTVIKYWLALCSFFKQLLHACWNQVFEVVLSQLPAEVAEANKVVVAAVHLEINQDLLRCTGVAYVAVIVCRNHKLLQDQSIGGSNPAHSEVDWAFVKKHNSTGNVAKAQPAGLMRPDCAVGWSGWSGWSGWLVDKKRVSRLFVFVAGIVEVVQQASPHRVLVKVLAVRLSVPVVLQSKGVAYAQPVHRHTLRAKHALVEQQDTCASAGLACLAGLAGPTGLSATMSRKQSLATSKYAVCVVLAPSLEKSRFWCLDLYGEYQLANIDIGPAKPSRTVLVCVCVLLSLQLCKPMLVDLDQQERLACRHFKGSLVCN